MAFVVAVVVVCQIEFVELTLASVSLDSRVSHFCNQVFVFVVVVNLLLWLLFFIMLLSIHFFACFLFHENIRVNIIFRDIFVFFFVFHS